MYTIQYHIGGCACPQGDDVETYSSKAACQHAFRQELDDAIRSGCAHGYGSEALVWKGEHDDTTDLYPDYVLRVGPRGGLVWELA